MENIFREQQKLLRIQHNYFHYAMDFNGTVAVVNNFFYLLNFSLLAQHIIYGIQAAAASAKKKASTSFYKYALLYVLTSVHSLLAN